MQKAADHLVDPFGKLSTVLSESEEAVREFDSVYQCNGYWKLILMSARRMRDSTSVALFLTVQISNRIYAIVYFAYISSIRMNIRVRIREVSHWYILRIEPISHCVYFEYPQIHHVSVWRILKLTSPDTTSQFLVPTWIVYCIGYAIRLCTLYTSLITYKFFYQ